MRYGKAIGKLVISIAGLYFVFSKVDFKSVYTVLYTADFLWLLCALVLLFLAQFLSAVRLNVFFGEINIMLTTAAGLKLYLAGMFYNIILPGGIGGDGYKAYKLRKLFNTSLADVVKALIADRVSGLVAIVFISIILLSFIDIGGSANYYLMGCIIPFYFIFVFLVKKIVPHFQKIIPVVLLQSGGVQILQMCAATCIALSVGAGLNVDFYLLFLVSSIASAIPVTIGGLGSRELVFYYGSLYLSFNTDTYVAVSILFFTITLLLSLSGFYFAFNDKYLKTPEKAIT